MIQSLCLKGYRAFEDYQLNNLARVNLLVGANNSGKSSILEAVHLLASQGDPRILMEIAQRRGEMAPIGDQRDYPLTDIAHFFHQHHIEPGQEFKIESKSPLGSLTFQLEELSEQNSSDLVRVRALRHRPELLEDLMQLGSMLALTIQHKPNRRRPLSLPVTEDGVLLMDIADRSLFTKRANGPSVEKTRYIAPDSLDSNLMARMWDRINELGEETKVFEAMRILEPDLRDLFFRSSGLLYRGQNARILVSFANQPKRVPLGSLGEGMRRLLALSLALNTVEGGFLLVDEIDTGLHYSIMGDMWLLVVQAAQAHNVQVFATTHSADCLRGLAWLSENHPELASEVSLQKVDKSLDEAVALDAEGIRIAAQQEIEVR